MKTAFLAIGIGAAFGALMLVTYLGLDLTFGGAW